MAELRNRLGWVDTARGIAIVLVVLYHAAQWMNFPAHPVGGWIAVDDALASLRMPLFFALSGMFARKWTVAPWRDLWRSKLSLFFWVFLVWEALGSLVMPLVLVQQGACCSVRGTVVNVALSLVLPRRELWFIWALALFFIVAKAARRIDPRLQLLVAGAISLAALTDAGWPLNIGWEGAAKYLFFFLVGLHLRPRLERLGSFGGPVFIALSIAVWAVVSVLVAFTALAEVPGVYFMNCVLGLVSGIALARMLGRISVLGVLGRRTLPVYLTHTPLIYIATFLLWLLPPGARLADVAAVVPPLLVAVVIPIGLLLDRVTARSPLRWLFTQPRWFALDHPQGRLTRSAP